MSGRLRESGDAASLSKDKLAELMKLRGEVALLRTRELESDWSIANAKTLQEKVDELQGQLEKLNVESIRGEFRARTDWADKGNADPFSAVETMLWAYG